MTNRIALWIGLVIVAVILLNFALGLELHIAVGRRFLELIQLVAVWR